TASAQRSEEFSEWRHPHDLVALTRETIEKLETGASSQDLADVAWKLLADDPYAVAETLIDAKLNDEELGRVLAYAAALRIVRFRVQTDHGDGDTVHRSFTAANALHQALRRTPTPELRRGCVHAALRIYLARFLNVPAARLPAATTGSLSALAECFDVQG